MRRPSGRLAVDVQHRVLLSIRSGKVCCSTGVEAWLQHGREDVPHRWNPNRTSQTTANDSGAVYTEYTVYGHASTGCTALYYRWHMTRSVPPTYMYSTYSTHCILLYCSHASGTATAGYSFTSPHPKLIIRATVYFSFFFFFNYSWQRRVRQLIAVFSLYEFWRHEQN